MKTSSSLGSATTATLITLATFVAVTFVSITPTLADDLSDPYQIFARARQYWEQQRYPDMVGYTIHVTATQRGATQERHYAARWSAQTNGVAVQVVSTEEQQHPFKPAGSTFAISAPLIATVTVGGNGAGTNGDLLGVPFVAPVYFFDIAKYIPREAATPAEIVAQIREQYHDPAPSKIAKLAAANGPPTIATVTSTNRDYTIWLLSIDPYGNHRDYHLVLYPVSDSQKHRLRELWINTDTFATDKLISQGNFTSAPSVEVSWTVTFSDIGGSRYIAGEIADAPLHTLPPESTLIKSHPGIFDTWMLSIEDVAPTSGPFFGGTSADVLTEP